MEKKKRTGTTTDRERRGRKEYWRLVDDDYDGCPCVLAGVYGAGKTIKRKLQEGAFPSEIQGNQRLTQSSVHIPQCREVEVEVNDRRNFTSAVHLDLPFSFQSTLTIFLTQYLTPLSPQTIRIQSAFLAAFEIIFNRTSKLTKTSSATIKTIFGSVNVRKMTRIMNKKIGLFTTI
ncbi:hypothetical protein CEXT_657501 [Caerostris extrusa]|uniref:Uncharacterized protein n=1 Tax=Caerostris extrusa TaxID=172846 RepID=A0AAV4XTR5_CAEEX|nr:hypothetical protein CEXT_657501 [Caerostris extrusa]